MGFFGVFVGFLLYSVIQYTSYAEGIWVVNIVTVMSKNFGVGTGHRPLPLPAPESVVKLKLGVR